MKHSFLQLRLLPVFLLVLVLNFVLTQDLYAQVCTGDITLSSQAEVDACNCREIEGNLRIGGYLGFESDITNLDALSELNSISGDLVIGSNSLLADINGLSGLSGDIGTLVIFYNENLKNLDGLKGISSIRGYIEMNWNNALVNLDGLCNVTSVEGEILSIYENYNLKNLDGLSALKNVAGDLRIINNYDLIRCSGLYPLLKEGTIGGIVEIGGNGAGCTQADILANGFCDPDDYIMDLYLAGILSEDDANTLTKLAKTASLDDLQLLVNDYIENGILSDAQGQTLILLASNFRSRICGDITLSSQAEVDAFTCTEVAGSLSISGSDITNLDGLSTLTHIGGSLHIDESHSLTNLDGLHNLTSVENTIYIYYNENLENIDGLYHISSLGETLFIWGNTHLKNLNGLSALKSVGGLTEIAENYSLENLDGLSALKNVGGDLYIHGNTVINRCCGLYPLLSDGTIGGETNFFDYYSSGCTEEDILTNGVCDPSNYIMDLYTSGTLSEDDANTLISMAETASLYDYRDQVNSFVENGMLSNAEGQTLMLLVINFRGSITLTSQAEVDNFNITEVAGKLIISGSDIMNLDGLSGLREVFQLEVRNNNLLTNLDGLSGLTTINELKISYNNVLTNLDGLSGLTRIDILNVDHNPSLSRCCGLYPLLSNSGDIGSINISNNDVGCTEVNILTNGFCSPGDYIMDLYSDGTLSEDDANTLADMAETALRQDFQDQVNTFVENSMLSNAEGQTLMLLASNYRNWCNGSITLSTQAEVDACTCNEISGSLSISGSDITNLDGLSILTQIGGGLSIEESHSLSNVDGLYNLSSVRSIFIYFNENLKNIDGLYNISSVESIFIFGNRNLQNLDGLSTLKSTREGLLIEQNPNLQNLDGLSTLNSVGQILSIIGTDSLKSLDGLYNLTYAGSIFLGSNKSLENIDGLYNVTSIGNELYIIDHENLKNLDGLSALKSVGRDLWINENKLLNLDGLSALKTVGGELIVTDNYNLNRCCGLYPVLNEGTIGAIVEIKENGSGCTETDILQGGYCSPCCYIQDLITDDVLNKGQANALMKKLLWVNKINQYSHRHHHSYKFKRDPWNDRVTAFLLRAFNNQVEAFVRCDKLSPAQGQTLILLASLSQECDYGCGQNSNLRIEQPTADNSLLEEIMDYELGQNYPNPVRDRTYVPFLIPEPTHVLLKLTDEMGRDVDILLNENVSLGYHEVELNTSSLTDGIYFYTLQTEKFQKTLPMVIKK